MLQQPPLFWGLPPLRTMATVGWHTKICKGLNLSYFSNRRWSAKKSNQFSRLPRGEHWQYELKFDGYRCIAIKQHNEVELYSSARAVASPIL